MGVLCGGRGNDFARVIGVPESIDEGVALLVERPVRSIDVGEVNGKRFLCIASCGFDSDANRIANETHAISGSLVYVYAALRALAGWKPARFTVTVDDERREREDADDLEHACHILGRVRNVGHRGDS